MWSAGAGRNFARMPRRRAMRERRSTRKHARTAHRTHSSRKTHCMSAGCIEITSSMRRKTVLSNPLLITDSWTTGRLQRFTAVTNLDRVRRRIFVGSISGGQQRRSAWSSQRSF
jgi:hypothetical protein